MRYAYYSLLPPILFASTVSAATWHVPADAPTIQAGIDSASVGDTVLVVCGTYYEHDIVMKSGICLLSETGEAGCATIDAQIEGRVLYCENVNESTLIKGFTITGGNTPRQPPFGGAGVYCGDHSSPTIESCTIRDNNCFGFAGGMICENHSSPTLAGVTFADNVASGMSHPGPGGGLYCTESSSPRLTDCAFIGNRGDGGSAMYTDDSSPVLERVVFDSNEIGYGTGGASGGTMVCWGGTATLIDIVFTGNVPNPVHPVHMGHLHLASCTEATLMRVTFSGNEAAPAATFSGCSPTVTSCTFYGNSAGEYSNGVVTCQEGASPVLERTLIAFNTEGPAIDCGDGQPMLECCDIFGNGGGDWVGCIEDQYGVNGNISADPLFCDAPNGDLTLDASSPCLPGNHPDGAACGLIGAWGHGCGSTPTIETTWSELKERYRK